MPDFCLIVYKNVAEMVHIFTLLWFFLIAR